MCVCAPGGRERKQAMIDSWETLSRKCNRLGFASGVSVYNSTSLSPFWSELCKGSFDCGCSRCHCRPPPLQKCCFRGAGSLSPLWQQTCPTLRALGTFEVGEKASATNQFNHYVVLELNLEGSAVSKAEEVEECVLFNKYFTNIWSFLK